MQGLRLPDAVLVMTIVPPCFRRWFAAMHARRLPARPGLEPYERQARELIEAHASRDPEALRSVRQCHARLRGRADTNDLFDLADSEVPSGRLSVASSGSRASSE